MTVGQDLAGFEFPAKPTRVALPTRSCGDAWPKEGVPGRSEGPEEPLAHVQAGVREQRLPPMDCARGSARSNPLTTPDTYQIPLLVMPVLGGWALSVINMVFAAPGHLNLVSGAITQEVIEVLAC